MTMDVTTGDPHQRHAAYLAERERRENFFRELDPPGGGTGWLVALIVLGALLILVLEVATIVIGLACIGVAVWALVRRSRGELTAITQQEFDDELRRVTWNIRSQALGTLRLDEEMDVLQEVGLLGGTVRPMIQGRMRSLGGVRPNPLNYWLPLAGSLDGSPRVCFARYQLHFLFALEDAVAYFTFEYDMIDQAHPVEYRANRIYYRFIENVQLTGEAFTLRTVSGQDHVFALRIPAEARVGNLARAFGRPLFDIDQAMWDQGTAFVATVNQLRDEWERRQRPR